MRGLGSENPQRFFEFCSTGVSAPFSIFPALLPGAQRDELRRDPVHSDAKGPLDPLKHQIDIADLQDTRDLFAFN
jgi:hypothetical protein